ncbi:MAG TPA: DUF5069 domain-containing protein [Chthoniobacterales bacterium]|nr:DUF5069 domain-containing protein [Chthoniobacterales bacterium]
MNRLSVRSPAAKIGGIVYFGRMLDKIRAQLRGELPPEYQANLGKGFDSRCVNFLRVDYGRLVERVAHGGSDEEILYWCFENGRRPSDEEIHIWNEFMRKCGWNDDISPTLMRRKKEAGMAGRSEIRTMFEFIDVDEGRSLPDALGFEARKAALGAVAALAYLSFR